MNKDKIREYIACPQFGDDHYGKWGALRFEQRDCIRRLLEENERLKTLYEKTCKHLFNIGNDELARYFQAQINECNVFVPQDLRGEE